MTKLFVPQAPAQAVRRERVTRRLEDGMRRRLTLISAPAGFGKTTLITDWYAANRNVAPPLAWLSLDRRDNEPARFLTYLIEAFHLASPDVAADARVLLDARSSAQAEVVITQLINGIAREPNDIVLVLDDYHMIDDDEIHQAMNFLLEHLPPNLHVVLTCRSDPPLSLSRFRARGEMADVRADELRFTGDETEQFLHATLGRSLNAEDILELEARTEGWPAGLQLAAISMRDADDIHAFIDSFSGQHHHVVDYLVDEVLDTLPTATQEFLLRTSLFDRFTPALCDLVTDRRDSHAMLDFLERSNLFLTALDSERQWHRYHHLFADLLRRKLQEWQPELIPELHRRASRWFEEQGDLVEAIWQTIYAEDWPRLTDLFKTNERRLFNQAQSRTMLQLLAATPEDVVQASPWLLFIRAACFDLNGEDARCQRDLSTLESLIDGIDHDSLRVVEIPEAERRWLRGSVARTRAFTAVLDLDFGATIERAGEALLLLPERDFEVRALTKGIRAQAYWLTGDLNGAAAGLSETLEESKLGDGSAARLVGLLGLGSIEAEWGHWDQAVAHYTEAIDFAAERGLSNWQYTGRIMSFQSEIPYELNDLEQALALAQRGREIAADWTSNHAYDATYLHLARVHHALDDLDAARAVLSAAPTYSGVGPGMGAVAQTEAFRALLELKAGDRRGVAAIEGELSSLIDEYLDRIWLWTPALIMRGRVLNAIERYADAVAILAPVFEICLGRGWTRQAVQAGSVLSVSHYRQGDPPTAIATFERVLEHAEPHGFIRSILDAGDGIASVVALARDSRRAEPDAGTYLANLLALAREEHRDQPADAAARQGLIDPLSERELEVLRLVAAGHTNAQVAEQLYIVVGTVKAHTNNIYSKLGVSSRTQAIKRGRELGIVD